MELIFSLNAMKRCSGQVVQDFEYFAYFTEECERRIKSAAGELALLADGAKAFDAQSEGMAKAALAEVRRTAFAIDTCMDWFKSRPQIGSRFWDLSRKLGADIQGAEENARLVARFFKESADAQTN